MFAQVHDHGAGRAENRCNAYLTSWEIGVECKLNFTLDWFMNLCNRLKEIRLQKGLTQESLANAAGVTRQTIIAIEKSKFAPSVKLALELASALHTPLEDVFWLEDKKGRKA